MELSELIALKNKSSTSPRNLTEALHYLKSNPGSRIVINQYVSIRRSRVVDRVTGRTSDTVDIWCHVSPCRRHAWLPAETSDGEIVRICISLITECLDEAKNRIVEDLARGCFEFCGN